MRRVFSFFFPTTAQLTARFAWLPVVIGGWPNTRTRLSLWVVYLVTVSILLLPLAWLKDKVVGTPSSYEETEQVVAQEIITVKDYEFTPAEVTVQAGDRIIIQTPKDKGFFVDGQYKAKAYPPYDEYINIQLTMPGGEKFRLSDLRSGLHVKTGGKITFLVVCEDKDVNIFSGSNLQAKRLTEFKRGDIQLQFDWVKTFLAVEMAKKVETIGTVKRDKDLELRKKAQKGLRELIDSFRFPKKELHKEKGEPQWL